MTGARAAMADLLNADPRGVVFGRSMTQLTMDLARTLAQGWGPGDEVVVTRLDHDSNVRTWTIAAERAGATVRWVDFDPATGELDAVAEVLSERTRVVAVTAASNLIGTRPDIPAIAAAVHDAGAMLHVDGVHYTAHGLSTWWRSGPTPSCARRTSSWGPTVASSPAGPRSSSRCSPTSSCRPATTIPERFELGTPAYELLAGTTAAVDFLAGLRPGRRVPPRAARGVVRRPRGARGPAARADRGGAGRAPGVTLHSRAARRTPTLLATFAGHDPQDVRRHLADDSVNAPAGSFYAYEASRRLGLGDEGGLRIGLAPYNDDRDVDRLLEALGEYLTRA